MQTSAGPSNSGPLDKFIKVSGAKTSNLQNNFMEKLLEFVVFDMRPFAVVESESFKNMIQLLSRDVKIPSRRAFICYFKEKAAEDIGKTKRIFGTSEYIATAADIWSCSSHGYMGVSATTITPDFQRHTRAIACRHFGNPHTGEKIRDILYDIHNEMVPSRSALVGTISDNGANIVRAFKLSQAAVQMTTTSEENVEGLGNEVMDVLKEFEDLSALPDHQR